MFKKLNMETCVAIVSILKFYVSNKNNVEKDLDKSNIWNELRDTLNYS